MNKNTKTLLIVGGVAIVGIGAVLIARKATSGETQLAYTDTGTPLITETPTGSGSGSDGGTVSVPEHTERARSIQQRLNWIRAYLVTRATSQIRQAGYMTLRPSSPFHPALVEDGRIGPATRDAWEAISDLLDRAESEPLGENPYTYRRPSRSNANHLLELDGQLAGLERDLTSATDPLLNTMARLLWGATSPTQS